MCPTASHVPNRIKPSALVCVQTRSLAVLLSPVGSEQQQQQQQQGNTPGEHSAGESFQRAACFFFDEVMPKSACQCTASLSCLVIDHAALIFCGTEHDNPAE